MDNQNGKSPLLALTVATMLFAALGVVVYTQAPFKGIRPSVSQLKEPPEKIRARLWQDPFEAVLDDLKARGPLSQPVMIVPKPDETGKSGKKAPQPHNPQIFDVDLKALRQEIVDHQALGKGVTILGVIVLGGPYAEMVEFRRDQRYAVLSGLDILKYYPEDEEHLKYLRILDISKGQVTWSQGDQENLSNIIPYEWLSSEGEKASVLLLWLNEGIFSEPLTQPEPLTKLANLQGDLNNLEFKIIGPPSSHSLLEIYKQLLLTNDKIKPNNVKAQPKIHNIQPNMTIYMATATADDKELLREVFKQYPQEIEDHFSKKYPDFSEDLYNDLLKELKDKTTVKLEAGTGKLENLTSTKLERTILSDRKTAEALIDELNNRNVDLVNQHFFASKISALFKLFGKTYDSRDHVVLVSEWDTFYGRMLPETFKDVIKERLDPETRKKISEISWVHRFSYLRGIDGKLPEEKKDSDKEKKKNDDSNKDERNIKKLEEPVGNSQYDYLRRLADRIARLEDTLQYEHQGSIRAIGVLGNDFYDKFLVLQALNQKFPDRIFFTTDLDANYFHPANLEWTRNLVVASTYGLQLREDLQNEVPPFRNAYQTSVFAATLRAFNFLPLQGTDFQKLQPRIFEIGRFSAIDLSNKAGSPAPINQASLVKGFPNWGLIGFIVTILLISLLTMLLWLSSSPANFAWTTIRQFPQKSFKVPPVINKEMTIINIWFGFIGFILAVIIIFFLITTRYPTEEPFFWSAGISVWPTEIIRFVASILAVGLFFWSRWRLNDNKEEINKTFSLNLNSKNKALELSNPNATAVPDGNKEWLTYISQSDFAKRRSWIILISAIYFLLCCIIIVSFGLPNNPVRGAFSSTINIIILFMTIASFLFLTFFVLDTIMLCQKFITLFVYKEPQWDEKSLQHVVKDWIIKSEHSSEDSHSSLKDAGLKDSEPCKKDRMKAALSEWMLVLLVARRTYVVGKLIFFPFIVWSLIIISRLHYFDNWRTPLGLVIVISLSAILAWIYAVNLRQSAEKLRTAVINRLDQQLLGTYVADPGNKTDTDCIKHVLDEVKAIKTGAFASYVQQPALQSLLVPIGGISGLKILEILSNLG